MWMIRSKGGRLAERWLEENVVGIGWDLGGADITALTRDQIRERYAETHPDESRGRVGSEAGQIWRFAHDFTQGTEVVTYDPVARLYHVGRVAGDCKMSDADGMTYERTVSWDRSVPRDNLSKTVQNKLGGIQTIFRVHADAETELRGEKTCHAATSTDEDEQTDPSDITGVSADDGIELIKDRASKLPWDAMEDLVAGLLRAMGYHARVTPRTGDGGRDVEASPDALGLQEPRIAVEVKHRAGAIGAPALRSFIGTLHARDCGLFVSTGGFTKEAKMEAARANVPVRLLDLDELVRLYVEFYDRADEQTCLILPLRCIWLPE